ncbi:MAG: hypothetical protein WC364_09305 [Eubacteriales bacterium]|jgi:NitT/TauT family transport system permease protein
MKLSFRENYVRRIISPASLFFLLLVLSGLLPGRSAPAGNNYLIGLAVIIQVIFLINLFWNKNKAKVQACSDVAALVLALLWLWDLFTARLGVLNKFLYPAPGNVLKLFTSEFPVMLKGLINSIQLLAGGYILALLIAIPLALIIGWRGQAVPGGKAFDQGVGADSAHCVYTLCHSHFADFQGFLYFCDFYRRLLACFH